MIIAIDTDRREVQTSDVLTVEAAQKAAEIMGYVVSQIKKPPAIDLTRTDTVVMSRPLYSSKKPKKADFDMSDPERVDAFLDQFNAAKAHKDTINKQSK